MKRPQLERGWEVEWCTHIPRVKDDDGNDTEESDLDNATICIADFATVEAARTFAKKVLPQDQFGCVAITRFEMQPYEPGFPAKFKEYTGDPEHYDGDES